MPVGAAISYSSSWTKTLSAIKLLLCRLGSGRFLNRFINEDLALPEFISGSPSDGGGKIHERGIVLILIPLLTLLADVMHKFEVANMTWGNAVTYHLDELYDANCRAFESLIRRCSTMKRNTTSTLFMFLSPQFLVHHLLEPKLLQGNTDECICCLPCSSYENLGETRKKTKFTPSSPIKATPDSITSDEEYLSMTSVSDGNDVSMTSSTQNESKKINHSTLSYSRWLILKSISNELLSKVKPSTITMKHKSEL